MSALASADLFSSALQHHQAGQLTQAEYLCRQVLAVEPNHIEALHLLGVLVGQGGQYGIAVELFRRVLAMRPDWVEALFNLAILLQQLGKFDEAVACFQRIVALAPDSPDARYNLGLALHSAGRVGETLDCYRQSLELKGDNFNAHNNLGAALWILGRPEEAIASYRRAVALKPDDAQAQSNLGLALSAVGESEDALTCCRRALAIAPNSINAYHNLAMVLQSAGRIDEAISCLRDALAAFPGNEQTHNNLGRALRAKGRMDEAVASFRLALSINPKYAEAYDNLGHAMQAQGQIAEAVACFRQVIALKPDQLSSYNNLLYIIYFLPDVDAREIFNEHQRWNKIYAAPLAGEIKPHTNDPSPARRLRIGYVSPDFRKHVIGRNLVPIFKHHDRGQFEVYCYADVPKPDALTEFFKQHADQWRSTVGLRDEQIADMVREDQIDILIDLTLHMAGTRLLTFARKPAPVQVSFVGCPGTTGLTTMDYRLTDPHLDPPGCDESVYSEQVHRLAHSFWCYEPFASTPPVNPLPADANGHITFGCLNNFTKVNDKGLALWSRVLAEVPNSHLLVLSPLGEHRQRSLEKLQRHGIAAERVEFATPCPHDDYLRLYNRLDISLDSLPVCGHTSSLDSYWMGVPVVSLYGTVAITRAGLSHLTNLGLTELATDNPDQYVKIAVDLARDLPRLRELRSTLRSRMEKSPLCDAPAFARDIETAYRTLWQRWCANAAPLR